jgi:uncharacterized protein
MTQFLIDSGAFLALLDTRDKFHAAAKQFTIANREASFFIPEFIFAETMTLVKARLGPLAAIELGKQIHKSTQFQLVHLTDEERQATWSIFSRYHDKAWSYADCSLLALAQQRQIMTVFSFDHHIDQMAQLTRIP